MARKIVTTITDDIDGSEGASPVTFAIDGSSYEIDLSDSNASTIRDALAPFVKAARRAPSSAQKGNARRPSATKVDRERSGAIRAWAKKNKITVSERGRIAAHVVKQYEAAN